MKLASLLGSAAFLGLALLNSALAAPEPAPASIPPAPYYYVLDQPKVLNSKEIEALQKLLIEHDRLTGEQIFVAIFDQLASPDSERKDPVARTNEVFQAWKVGKRGKDNGALLGIYVDRRKAALVTGFGLDNFISDEQKDQLVSHFLLPEWKGGNRFRAVSITVHELLRILGSPLIESGEAGKVLRQGGFTGPWEPIPPSMDAGWIFWFLLGALLVFGTVYYMTAAELHLSSGGLYRVKPWDLIRELKLKFAKKKLRDATAGLGGTDGSW